MPLLDEVQQVQTAERQQQTAYNEERRDKLTQDALDAYAGLFGEEAAGVEYRKVPALGYAVAVVTSDDETPLRFAWTVSRSSGSKHALHLIRTCPRCGGEWVTDSYVYCVNPTDDADRRRQAVKRVSDLLTRDPYGSHRCREGAVDELVQAASRISRTVNWTAYQLVEEAAGVMFRGNDRG